MSATDATNGRGYIVCQSEPWGDRQVRVHLLLPSGRRRTAVLDVTALTDEVLGKTARALEEDLRRARPGRLIPTPIGESG